MLFVNRLEFSCFADFFVMLHPEYMVFGMSLDVSFSLSNFRKIKCSIVNYSLKLEKFVHDLISLNFKRLFSVTNAFRENSPDHR